MMTVNILGVPHAYEMTAPTASPRVLVFVHGWLMSRGYWQPLVDRLSPQYQCLTYDLRGFGLSHASALDEDLSQVNLQTPLAGETIAPQPVTPQLIKLPREQGVAVASSAESEPALAKRVALNGGGARGGKGFTTALEAPAVASNSLWNQGGTSYTPAAYGRDLTILLQQLGITQAWLVGHSLGGTIALWAAHQLPERVEGVICVNSGGGIYLKEEFEKFRMAGQQLLKMRPRWLCQLPLIDLLFTRASVAQPIARCWGRQRLLDFVMAHPEAALGSLLDSTTEAEVHQMPQLVAQLQQPAYFIAGAQDPIMEPKYVRHLASFHPLFQTCGDNVIEVPNCGHLSMVEQPDVVAAHLQKILDRHT